MWFDANESDIRTICVCLDDVKDRIKGIFRKWVGDPK